MRLDTRIYSHCLLISQLLLVYTWSDDTHTSCNDLDTAVCDELGETNTNLCNDTCTRNICKRYCGLCPLICRSCTNIDQPENCHENKTCTGSDQSCIVMQTVTPSFEIGFTMDCASNTVCKQLYHKRTIRGIDLYGGCCTYDLCNKHMPYMDDTARLQSKDTKNLQTFNNGQRNPCADIHKSLCQKLTNVGSCSDECVSRLCPETCNRCLNCYSCENITKTGHCNGTKLCLPDEVCKITDISGRSLVQSYKLGCASEKNCTADDIQNGHCCNTSKCNNLTVVRTDTSTTQPDTSTQVSSSSTQMTTTSTQMTTTSTQMTTTSTQMTTTSTQMTTTSTQMTTMFLTCYSCQNISNPLLCNQTRRCRDSAQVCMTSMKISSHGEMQFTLGCSNRSICGTNEMETCTTTKMYKSTVCCDTGLCNNIYPKEQIRNSGILSNVPKTTNKACPAGFYTIPQANSCYHFGKTALIWVKAKDYCESFQSHLARIECEDEESLLSTFIKQNYGILQENINDHLLTHGTFYWLDGLRNFGDKTNDTNWFWSSTGKELAFFNWRPGIPDNIGNRENCLDFGPGEYYGHSKQGVQYYWNDRWCGERLYPLCEIDL